MTTVRTGLALATVIALRAISASILLNPSTYTQDRFVTNFETEQEAGCIAFHHVRLHRTKRQLDNLVKKHEDAGPFRNFEVLENPFFIAAKKDLKLTQEQAERLLGGTDKWPKKYMDAYENAKTSKGSARALHSRIEFFIESRGTDKTVKELAAEAKAAA